MFEYIQNGDIGRVHLSQDKTVNEFRSLLSNMYKAYSMYIVNGRLGNASGDFTLYI